MEDNKIILLIYRREEYSYIDSYFLPTDPFFLLYHYDKYNSRWTKIGVCALSDLFHNKNKTVYSNIKNFNFKGSKYINYLSILNKIENLG